MGGRHMRFACVRCGLAVTLRQARHVEVLGITVWYCRACWLAIRREQHLEVQA